MHEKSELENKIPHDINWIYFGPKIFDTTGNIRESFSRNICKWVQNNPQATFKLWINKDELDSAQYKTLNNFATRFSGKLQLLDQKQVIALTPEVTDERSIQYKIYQLFLLELTHPKGNYAAASDLFRLLVLYKKGGIYSDLDVTCAYRIKEDLEAPLGLLVYFSKFNIRSGIPRGDMSNCLVAASSYSPIIETLFKVILRKYQYNEEKYGSMGEFFNSRTSYEIMNTSGSDAYRQVLTQQNKSLFFRVQPQYFIGVQCFLIDFFTQSINPETVAAQAESGALESSMIKEEFSTTIPRFWDLDLIHSLLDSTFEKAWTSPKQIEHSTNPRLS
jgi:hypothetical protein